MSCATVTVSSAPTHEQLQTTFLPGIQTTGTNSISRAAIVDPASNKNSVSAMSHETNGRGRQTASQLNGYSDGDLSSYALPDHRLRRKLDDSSKTPLVLVACGSFSPITNLHLRMFEMVADHVRFHTEYEIVGGYLSPVSDAYKKAGLASAKHRSVLHIVYKCR